jgi:NAD(P)-dependent dehydrogenase (short-subunit alcohol dehydrogenase family)
MALSHSDDTLALTGKTVVVTGAGRGVGAAVAQAAAAAGACVVVNDIDAEPAEACAGTIRAAGGQAIAHVADVGDWPQAEGLIERCLEAYGQIDGLVNNAGIAVRMRSWELEEAEVRQVLNAHLISTLACTTRALKSMRARGSGSIVNTTSGAAMGSDYQSAYSAAKGAISSFTYTAAIEARGSGVRVNAMSPFAATRMTENSNAFLKWASAQNVHNPQRPEAFAGVYVYLLSDRAREVNGQVIGIRPDGELYIAGHPCGLEPMVTQGRWTAAATAQAMESGALAPLQPLGFNRMRTTPGETRDGYTGVLEPR